MKRRTQAGRVAERELRGVDDAGEEERILLWIERRPGALWAVCRAVNLHRRTDFASSRPEDTLFEGYELSDALDRANDALEDDLRVLEDDGTVARVRPFTRKEALPLLERWFFGR